jgi:hypothetical protein
MRLGRLVLALAMIGLVALMGTASSSAQGTVTVAEQAQGALVGVGPDQRTLIVAWTDQDFGGCGVFGVAGSAAETADSVSVTLVAQVGVDEPGSACGAPGQFGTVTVTLAAPLAGRAVKGLQLLGWAFSQYNNTIAGFRMPKLAGLSPHDARFMLTLPSLPIGERPIGGLVDHHTHHSKTGALAMVVAQRPLAGKLIRRHTIVVLTVAP